VHEGGWKVARGADGKPAFTSPTGFRLPRRPRRERVGDIVTWLDEWTAREGVELGPETNMPRWDGSTPDYSAAVGSLPEAG